MTPDRSARGGTIRRLRQERGSVPITRDLYASTHDPTVLAFQLDAMFTDDDTLTLAALQDRWNVGRPKATVARRFLIDSGYWAELRVPMSGGRWSTETVAWEAALSFDDLLELAVSVPPGTHIESAGQRYIVGAEHELRHRVAENCDPATTSGNSDRVAVSCDPERPGKTPTGSQPDATRSDQGKDPKPERRTESQKTVTPPCKEHDDEHHGDGKDDAVEQFWRALRAVVAVDPPGRNSVHAQVRAALNGPWTPDHLAQWVLGRLKEAGKSVQRPAGFVIAQLRGIPTAPPSDRFVDGSNGIPWCGQCGTHFGDDRARVNAKFRQVLDDDGTEHPCPVCHPTGRAASPAA